MYFSNEALLFLRSAVVLWRFSESSSLSSAHMTVSILLLLLLLLLPPLLLVLCMSVQSANSRLRPGHNLLLVDILNSMSGPIVLTSVAINTKKSPVRGHGYVGEA